MKLLIAAVVLGCCACAHSAGMRAPDISPEQLVVCRVSPEDKDTLECMELNEFLARVRALQGVEM